MNKPKDDPNSDDMLTKASTQQPMSTRQLTRESRRGASCKWGTDKAERSEVWRGAVLTVHTA
jgi:hypothetical protein